MAVCFLGNIVLVDDIPFIACLMHKKVCIHVLTIFGKENNMFALRVKKKGEEKNLPKKKTIG